MIDIEQLVEQSHSLAIEKGWWHGQDRSDVNVPLAKIALIHSELSEAWREAEVGRFDTWHRSDGKPEGVAIELADAVIRAADLIGWLGHRLLDVAAVDYQPLAVQCLPFPVKQQEFRCFIDDATELIRDGDNFGAAQWLARFILEVEAGYRESWPGTLAEAIDIKHAYNKTRSRRHGGKLA